MQLPVAIKWARRHTFSTLIHNDGSHNSICTVGAHNHVTVYLRPICQSYRNIHVVNRPATTGKTRYSSRPSNPPTTTTAYSTTSVADSRYGLSGDEISIQPEHCTFLVDAVKEMDLCSRIFSAWVEQAER